MEANEAQVLKEHAEHAAYEAVLRPVAFTMSVLAMLQAVTAVLGHRTHTEAILFQNQTTDQWNEDQAHKIRVYETELTTDPLSAVTIADQHAADTIAKSHADHEKKWADELKEEQERAERLQRKVEQAEARAHRFDLAEALLEIGLVITSVTLLTRSRIYWYLGLGFPVLGAVSAATTFLIKRPSLPREKWLSPLLACDRLGAKCRWVHASCPYRFSSPLWVRAAVGTGTGAGGAIGSTRASCNAFASTHTGATSSRACCRARCNTAARGRKQ